MSGRTLSRLALVGLLGAAFAGSARAEAPEVAPMPRPARQHGEISLGFQIGGPQVIQIQYEVKLYGQPERAPMPRVKTAPRGPLLVTPPLIIQAEEEIIQTEGVVPPPPKPVTVSVGQGLRLKVPELGPAPLALDFPVATASDGRREPLGFSVGLFGGPQDDPEVAPMPRGDRPKAVQIGSGPAVPHDVFEVPLNTPPVVSVAAPPGVWVLDTNPVMPRNWQMTQQPGAIVINERGFDFKSAAAAQKVQATGYPCCQTATTTATLVASTKKAQPDLRFPHPLGGVTTLRWDEAGRGWWVTSSGIPQPRQEITQWTGPFGLDHSIVIGIPQPRQAPPAPVAIDFGFVFDGPIGSTAQVVRAQPATEAQPACCTAKAGKLSGTWVREANGMVIAATFTGDEMKLCISVNADGHVILATVIADYAVTKEGLVHGVVTGADVDVKSGPKAKTAEAERCLGESRTVIQSVVDAPFCFRMKSTSAGMMVSGFKCAGVSEENGPEVLVFANGLYKSCKECEVPAPNPMGIQRVGGLTLPSGRYLEHYPQYFPPDAVCPMPHEVPAPPVPYAGYGAVTRPQEWRPDPARCEPAMPTPVPPVGWTPGSAPQLRLLPLQPANVPPMEFGMMADVFGQMLSPKPQLVPPCPVPCPAPCPHPVQPASGVVLPPVSNCLPPVPSGVYIPPGLSYPQPVLNSSSFPPPTVAVAQSLPTMPAPVKPGTNGTHGTWTRQVGPLLYVVKIGSDHVTISVSASMELEEGKPLTQGVVLTADYHLARDGTTMVGLITSADMILEGDVPALDAVDEFGEKIRDFQKAYSDKPMAMTVRLYGDTLVIGNVRLPEGREGKDADVFLGAISGRYKNAGDKADPKPKLVRPVIKSQFSTEPVAPRQGQGKPACAVPSADPLRFVPPPDAPVPSPSRFTPPAPSEERIPATRVPEARSPVTPMTAPVPPPAAEEKPAPVESKPKKSKKKAEPEKPAARVPELLYQNEDLNQIKNAWRQFWFNDQPSALTPVTPAPRPWTKPSQPSHLTPERIHGGIL